MKTKLCKVVNKTRVSTEERVVVKYLSGEYPTLKGFYIRRHRKIFDSICPTGQGAL